MRLRSYVFKGIAAGVFATAAIAVILLLNAEFRLLPALDFAARLTGYGPALAWLALFAAGGLFGALLAWLDPDLPGNSLRQRGVVLAGVVWFLAMLFLMPAAGFGPFALESGPLMPLALLGLHLLLGAVTGGCYGWLLLQAVPLRFRKVYDGSPAARAVLTRTDTREAFAEATLVPESALEAAPAAARRQQQHPKPSASPSR